MPLLSHRRHNAGERRRVARAQGGAVCGRKLARPTRRPRFNDDHCGRQKSGATRLTWETLSDCQSFVVQSSKHGRSAMKLVLAFATIAFLFPATALAGKAPCTDDKLKFCRESTADVG